VPDTWTLIGRDGRRVLVETDQPTLVVAVKADCDGCASFHSGSLDPLAEYRVVLVAHAVRGVAELESAPEEVFEAPELLEALEMRWPPVYALVAGRPARVLVEGVAFSPEQVAHEIRSF
jgi:hypothetical protein